MLSAKCLFVVLLGVVWVSADGPPLQIGSPNGLMATLSSTSISITRQLPSTTLPPPITPVGSQPPPMTAPQASSSLPPQANVSGSSMPSGPPPSQPMNSLPPPAGSTMPPTAAAPLTTGMITLAVASIRELDSNFTQVVSSQPRNVNGLNGNGVSVMNPFIQPTIPGSSPSVRIVCQSIQNYLYPVSNTSTLTINLCGIMNNGTVTYGQTETTQVAMGQLGLSVQVMGWPWTSTGSYLEFNVSLSVMSGRKISVTSSNSVAPVTMGLGTSDSYAVLSTQVTDPSYTTFKKMPDGYPMLTQDNSADNMAIVTAMLPSSSSQPIVWNAVIEPGYQPSQKPPGPVSAAEGLVASWMIHAVTAALACLAGSFDRRH